MTDPLRLAQEAEENYRKEQAGQVVYGRGASLEIRLASALREQEAECTKRCATMIHHALTGKAFDPDDRPMAEQLGEKLNEVSWLTNYVRELKDRLDVQATVLRDKKVEASWLHAEKARLEQKVKAKQSALDLNIEEKMVSRREDGLLGYGKEIPVCSCGNYIVNTAHELYELRLQGIERIEELEAEVSRLQAENEKLYKGMQYSRNLNREKGEELAHLISEGERLRSELEKKDETK